MNSPSHTLEHDAPESPRLAGAPRGGPTDPSHDESLRRGILHTDVARPVAAALACAFLLVIYAVPIGQAIRDKVNGDPPVLLDLLQHAPTKENLRQLEDDLDKASAPRELIRPRMQAALTRYGGYGNTKAVVGRDGWLFYGPGVTAVGGPGFLDPEQIDARRKASLDAGDAAIAADPRPAILDFARFLARRGIRLVLFPVPDKASLQPVQLHGRARDLARPPARNADARRLAGELRAAGVLVFDPSPDVLPVTVDSRGARYFLQQDTHWTPAWMESVASDLARFLIAGGAVAAAPPVAETRAWRAVAKSVSRVGDITDMLGLPDGQTLFAPETVEIHEVSDAAGHPFESNERAGVLLLGDSFTNVFSLDQMGWGASAGLAAHLARALGRDVDVIAQNDAGAHATRRLLANALGDAPAGGDRLTGKTVVIWELASRELAVGDFKPVAWPAPRAPGVAGAAGEGAR